MIEKFMQKDPVCIDWKNNINLKREYRKGFQDGRKQSMKDKFIMLVLVFAVYCAVEILCWLIVG